MNILRSELYEKAWLTPMTRLARELGISDVGLAKACRRHSIPVPPRGYWARVRAGQAPAKTPLPAPELNITVDFATSDPAEQERMKLAQRLDHSHPLVSATQRYCETLPRLIARHEQRGPQAWHLVRDEERPPYLQHGRYCIFREGLLNVTASLKAMDWILRFHDAVFKALLARGMSVRWCPATPARGQVQGVPARVQLEKDGETFVIEFSQGYRRATGGESTSPEKSTRRVTGSERGASKTWSGDSEKLESLAADIVRSIIQLVPQQM